MYCNSPCCRARLPQQCLLRRRQTGWRGTTPLLSCPCLSMSMVYNCWALALIGGFMKLTPGKLAGLKRVSNERGVIAAAAMDQRGSLQKSLAKEKGGEVTDQMMEEFKSLVTEVLTPHASAILLDPEWGLPASKRRAKNAGLLLAYEKTGYDKTGPGRLPDL